MQDILRPWKGSWRLQLGLLVLVVAMVFFGYRTYRAVEVDLSTAAISGRSSISVLAASMLTQDFQRLIDVGRTLASRVRFGELISAGRWQEAIQIMAAVPGEFPAIEQVTVIDLSGKLQAWIPLTDASTPLADSNWHAEAVASGKPFISDVEINDNKVAHAVFFVSVPVIDRTGKVTAILGLRINTQHFVDLYSRLHLEPDGSIHVVDRRGTGAFDSSDLRGSQRTFMYSDPIVREVLQGKTGVAIDIPGLPDGNHSKDSVYVSAYAPASFGWGIVAQWPHSTVFALRDEELARVTIAFALILAMTIAAVGLLIQVVLERKQTETERRLNTQLEARVRERTAQLEDMNRELESFSYSISHDLRAPLRAIDGYSSLLVEDHHDELSANAKRYVDNVHRNVVHMAQLIDELLELARVGRVALEYRQINMNAMVRGVLQELSSEYPQLPVTLSDLPFISGDETLIRQIWVNLIDNAAKYSSHVDDPRVDVTAECGATETVYCVADNGAGFDMQHYDQLFKPFSRLHSPGEFAGTGVGLAIVKRIVERHEGRIWAESVTDQGTRIFFAIPNRSPEV